MTCQEARVSLGAYVLGSLDEAERRAVADHLRGCAACRVEHASLAALPGLLALVPADEAEASDGPAGPGSDAGGGLGRAWADRLAPAPSADLERRVMAAAAAEKAAARRRRYRLGIGLAAAALVGAVGGGVAVAALTGSDEAGTGAQRPSAGVSATATDPVSGVTGQVVMSPRAWGTALAVDVDELPAGTHCSLVVTAQDGRRDVAAGWTAVYERPARVQGATAVPLQDIANLQVRTATGQTLVTWWPPHTAGRSTG